MVRMTEKFVRILSEVKKAVGIYFTEVEPSKFLVLLYTYPCNVPCSIK